MQDSLTPSSYAPLDTYSLSELQDFVISLGQPKFRAKQIFSWVYQKGISSYEGMTNVPATLRAQLAEQAPLYTPEILETLHSEDGSRKYLLKLYDGQCIETVGIPSREVNEKGQPRRLTVCFSTQVGCAIGCAFCATGREGFSRNLLPGEMVQQLLLCQKDFNLRVSNAVGMGQGEPFMNYHNVMKALRIMNSPEGLGIGARHITVSTCGIVKGIEALSSEPEQFTLALSLHSADQGIRNQLMPACANAPLSEVKQSLAHYIEKTNRRVSLEYLLIKGLTDTDDQIDKLLDFCDGLLVHVNLLKINDVPDSPFQPTSEAKREYILTLLHHHRIEATVRDSRGSDIDGACGQLKTRIFPS